MKKEQRNKKRGDIVLDKDVHVEAISYFPSNLLEDKFNTCSILNFPIPLKGPCKALPYKTKRSKFNKPQPGCY